jgi:hypothetical protein
VLVVAVTLVSAANAETVVW